MAYDEGLAQRVTEALADQPDLIEKRMFGGVGFMFQGNMACGVLGEDLIVRVGPDGYEAALARPHAHVFDFSGRPMRGWVTVGPAGYEADDDLQTWLQQGVEFALSLPPK